MVDRAIGSALAGYDDEGMRLHLEYHRRHIESGFCRSVHPSKVWCVLPTGHGGLHGTEDRTWDGDAGCPCRADGQWDGAVVLEEWNGLKKGDQVRLDDLRGRFTFKRYFKSASQEFVEIIDMKRGHVRPVSPDRVKARR